MICNLLCTIHALQFNSVIVDNDTEYYELFSRSIYLLITLWSRNAVKQRDLENAYYSTNTRANILAEFNIIAHAPCTWHCILK